VLQAKAGFDATDERMLKTATKQHTSRQYTSTGTSTSTSTSSSILVCIGLLETVAALTQKVAI
jgi:tRNA G26 N,N-dimethylase Trm1